LFDLVSPRKDAFVRQAMCNAKIREFIKDCSNNSMASSSVALQPLVGLDFC
jgi:hypothetical protein